MPQLTNKWASSHSVNISLKTGFLLLFVFAYIILTPSLDLIPSIGLYDEKRLLECCLLLFGASSLLTNQILQQNYNNLFLSFTKTQRVLMGSIVTLGLLSSVYAADIQKALLEVSLILLLSINCLLLALQWQKDQAHTLQIFSYAILTAAGFYLIAFLAAYLSANINGASSKHIDLFINFSHVRFLSQFQSWTLPLIVLPVLLSERFRKGPGLWLFLSIASGWWLILFASGTRGTLLGLIIASLVTAWAFGRRSRSWFKWQSVTASIGLLLYCLLFLLPPLLGGMDTSVVQDGTIGRSLTHPHGRFHLWEVALTMITENPIMGVGPMHYACGITNGIATHPHNGVLQLAAEWGVPATLMGLILWFNGIRAWITQGRYVNTQDSAGTIHPIVYPALLASLVTASIHALFSGIIVMPLSQMTMILVIGCMLGIYRLQTSKPDKTIPSNYTRIIWLLLVIFAVFGLICGVMPDLRLSNGLFSATHIPTDASHLMPRFWQQGVICG